MEPIDTLYLRTYCPVKTQKAGLFISRGTAQHPTRVIDSHELILVKQGELDMWEGDQLFHLEAGQTLHLWPGRQYGSIKTMPLGLKFYWIYFEIEGRHGRTPHNTGETIATVIKIPQVKQMCQPERLERLFRAFLDDQVTGVLNPYSANLLTMLMLVEVAQSDMEKPINPDDLNALATSVHTYIRINYDRPITTSKVAESLGYNADYLGRIYRKMYGFTITEAINRRRIEKACQYLLDTHLTVEQVAQK